MGNKQGTPAGLAGEAPPVVGDDAQADDAQFDDAQANMTDEDTTQVGTGADDSGSGFATPEGMRSMSPMVSQASEEPALVVDAASGQITRDAAPEQAVLIAAPKVDEVQPLLPTTLSPSESAELQALYIERLGSFSSSSEAQTVSESTLPHSDALAGTEDTISSATTLTPGIAASVPYSPLPDNPSDSLDTSMAQDVDVTAGATQSSLVDNVKSILPASLGGSSAPQASSTDPLLMERASNMVPSLPGTGQAPAEGQTSSFVDSIKSALPTSLTGSNQALAQGQTYGIVDSLKSVLPASLTGSGSPAPQESSTGPSVMERASSLVPSLSGASQAPAEGQTSSFVDSIKSAMPASLTGSNQAPAEGQTYGVVDSIKSSLPASITSSGEGQTESAGLMESVKQVLPSSLGGYPSGSTDTASSAKQLGSSAMDTVRSLLPTSHGTESSVDESMSIGPQSLLPEETPVPLAETQSMPLLETDVDTPSAASLGAQGSDQPLDTSAGVPVMERAESVLLIGEEPSLLDKARSAWPVALGGNQPQPSEPAPIITEAPSLLDEVTDPTSPAAAITGIAAGPADKPTSALADPSALNLGPSEGDVPALFESKGLVAPSGIINTVKGLLHLSGTPAVNVLQTSTSTDQSASSAEAPLKDVPSDSQAVDTSATDLPAAGTDAAGGAVADSSPESTLESEGATAPSSLVDKVKSLLPTSLALGGAVPGGNALQASSSSIVADQEHSSSIPALFESKGLVAPSGLVDQAKALLPSSAASTTPADSTASQTSALDTGSLTSGDAVQDMQQQFTAPFALSAEEVSAAQPPIEGVGQLLDSKGLTEYPTVGEKVKSMLPESLTSTEGPSLTDKVGEQVKSVLPESLTSTEGPSLTDRVGQQVKSVLPESLTSTEGPSLTDQVKYSIPSEEISAPGQPTAGVGELLDSKGLTEYPTAGEKVKSMLPESLTSTEGPSLTEQVKSAVPSFGFGQSSTGASLVDQAQSQTTGLVNKARSLLPAFVSGSSPVAGDAPPSAFETDRLVEPTQPSAAPDLLPEPAGVSADSVAEQQSATSPAEGVGQLLDSKGLTEYPTVSEKVKSMLPESLTSSEGPTLTERVKSALPFTGSEQAEGPSLVDRAKALVPTALTGGGVPSTSLPASTSDAQSLEAQLPVIRTEEAAKADALEAGSMYPEGHKPNFHAAASSVAEGVNAVPASSEAGFGGAMATDVPIDTASSVHTATEGFNNSTVPTGLSQAPPPDVRSIFPSTDFSLHASDVNVATTPEPSIAFAPPTSGPVNADVAVPVSATTPPISEAPPMTLPVSGISGVPAIGTDVADAYVGALGGSTSVAQDRSSFLQQVPAVIETEAALTAPSEESQRAFDSATESMEAAPEVPPVPSEPSSAMEPSTPAAEQPAQSAPSPSRGLVGGILGGVGAVAGGLFGVVGRAATSLTSRHPAPITTETPIASEAVKSVDTTPMAESTLPEAAEEVVNNMVAPVIAESPQPDTQVPQVLTASGDSSMFAPAETSAEPLAAVEAAAAQPAVAADSLQAISTPPALTPLERVEPSATEFPAEVAAQPFTAAETVAPEPLLTQVVIPPGTAPGTIGDVVSVSSAPTEPSLLKAPSTSVLSEAGSEYSVSSISSMATSEATRSTQAIPTSSLSEPSTIPVPQPIAPITPLSVQEPSSVASPVSVPLSEPSTILVPQPAAPITSSLSVQEPSAMPTSMPEADPLDADLQPVFSKPEAAHPSLSAFGLDVSRSAPLQAAPATEPTTALPSSGGLSGTIGSFASKVNPDQVQQYATKGAGAAGLDLATAMKVGTASKDAFSKFAGPTATSATASTVQTPVSAQSVFGAAPTLAATTVPAEAPGATPAGFTGAAGSTFGSFASKVSPDAVKQYTTQAASTAGLDSAKAIQVGELGKVGFTKLTAGSAVSTSPEASAVPAVTSAAETTAPPSGSTGLGGLVGSIMSKVSPAPAPAVTPAAETLAPPSGSTGLGGLVGSIMSKVSPAAAAPAVTPAAETSAPGAPTASTGLGGLVGSLVSKVSPAAPAPPVTPAAETMPVAPTGSTGLGGQVGSFMSKVSPDQVKQYATQGAAAAGLDNTTAAKVGEASKTAFGKLSVPGMTPAAATTVPPSIAPATRAEIEVAAAPTGQPALPMSTSPLQQEVTTTQPAVVSPVSAVQGIVSEAAAEPQAPTPGLAAGPAPAGFESSTGTGVGMKAAEKVSGVMADATTKTSAAATAVTSKLPTPLQPKKRGGFFAACCGGGATAAAHQ
eukprot:jgi/Chlat1/1766/Chrsp134S02101